MFVDTHAHLTYDDLRNQLDAIIKRAAEARVEKIICVGTDLSSSRQSISISEQYPQVFASVGIHPHDAQDAPSSYLNEIRDLASHPSVVAIGEIGLDFYRNLSPRPVQVEVFTNQLKLAHELDLPAIVHNRDADEHVIQVINSVGHKKGVLHCFSSDVAMARWAIEFGFLISFTGNVTFSKSLILEEVLKQVPLESVMLETDCPYLAPVPKRGKTNEPANIPYIADRIAEIVQAPVETVAEVTSSTSHRFFGLPA